MDLKEIYLPVEKVKVDTILPGFQHQSGNEYATIVTKPNGEKLIANYCSKLYHLVKNEDVIEPFIRELSKQWGVKTEVKMVDFTQFHVDFLITDNQIEIMEKDKIYPRVRLSNSYDGRVRYHFSMGFHRLVCSNGLTVPVGEELKVRKLHTPSLSELTDFSKVLEMTASFLKQGEQLSDVYYELAENKIRNLDLRIEQVIDDTGFPTSLEEEVKERAAIEMEMLNLQAPNDWLIYNAFNYQLNHNEDIKTKELKKEQIDSEVMGYLLDY